MDQVTDPVVLVADHLAHQLARGRIEVPRSVQASAHQDAVHGSGPIVKPWAWHRPHPQRVAPHPGRACS
ncbi:hypothetical protein ACFYO0_00560 [Streptomyces sp. NPDC006365]|uniref:hypothetical protein n=1 Tax=Streptomyces sp. NPDC006365 TaxID=3364744 RepID=UPI00367EEE70